MLTIRRGAADGGVSVSGASATTGATFSASGASEPPPSADEPKLDVRMLHAIRAHNVSRIFERFDRNGDGSLSTSELRDAMAHLGVGASHDEQLVRVLRRYDENADGSIGLGEFYTMYEDILSYKSGASGPGGVPADVRAFFEAATQRTGSRGIGYAELASLLPELGVSSAHDAQVAAVFNRYDHHGNGELELPEFVHLVSDIRRLADCASVRPEASSAVAIVRDGAAGYGPVSERVRREARRQRAVQSSDDHWRRVAGAGAGEEEVGAWRRVAEELEHARAASSHSMLIGSRRLRAAQRAREADEKWEMSRGATIGVIRQDLDADYAAPHVPPPARDGRGAAEAALERSRRHVREWLTAWPSSPSWIDSLVARHEESECFRGDDPLLADPIRVAGRRHHQGGKEEDAAAPTARLAGAAQAATSSLTRELLLRPYSLPLDDFCEGGGFSEKVAELSVGAAVWCESGAGSSRCFGSWWRPAVVVELGDDEPRPVGQAMDEGRELVVEFVDAFSTTLGGGEPERRRTLSSRVRPYTAALPHTR
jgi:Ca2+-binding EF-hand superfamily protein